MFRDFGDPKRSARRTECPFPTAASRASEAIRSLRSDGTLVPAGETEMKIFPRDLSRMGVDFCST